MNDSSQIQRLDGGCRTHIKIGYIICLPTVYEKIECGSEMFLGFTTSPDGAVVMSSANGLVGTGFASWYRLHLYKTKHVCGVYS